MSEVIYHGSGGYRHNGFLSPVIPTDKDGKPLPSRFAQRCAKAKEEAANDNG